MGSKRYILVFKYLTAGVQIPAGTVEKGEDLETAVKREAYEETGLKLVEIEEYLGCIEIIIITQTAAIALEPLTTHPDEWAEPSHK